MTNDQLTQVLKEKQRLEEKALDKKLTDKEKGELLRLQTTWSRHR